MKISSLLKISVSLPLATATLSVAFQANAAILTVTESGLGGDSAAIIETSFGEDVLAFSDRTHEHNGAAFDTAGVLSTAGSNVVPLPSYLIGNDFVRFANNARDNSDYSATVTADTPTNWYLLIDNRLDGPAGNRSSSNSTDPVLGGTLQWVIDDGWTRVNTGISPLGQADYTGVDEGGNGIGAGIGLNQFYSVWTQSSASSSIVVNNNGIGSSNMISLVGSPAPVSESVPEPSTLGFLALGTLGAATLKRKKKV